MTLAEEITHRLQSLQPTELYIEDESAMHAGHAGNSGGGHFKLKMTSSHFNGKSHIIRHRLIYQLLADLIPNRIHALSIESAATHEPSSLKL